MSQNLNSKLPIFPISVIAEILDVHQRTLRIYDEKGLLIPDRTGKKRRLYSLEDLEKAKLIQFLTRSLGVNLTGVKMIIYLLKNCNIKESDHLKSIEKIAEIINAK